MWVVIVRLSGLLACLHCGLAVAAETDPTGTLLDRATTAVGELRAGAGDQAPETPAGVAFMVSPCFGLTSASALRRAGVAPQGRADDPHYTGAPVAVAFPARDGMGARVDRGIVVASSREWDRSLSVEKDVAFVQVEGCPGAERGWIDVGRLSGIAGRDRFALDAGSWHGETFEELGRGVKPAPLAVLRRTGEGAYRFEPGCGATWDGRLVIQSSLYDGSELARQRPNGPKLDLTCGTEETLDGAPIVLPSAGGPLAVAVQRSEIPRVTGPGSAAPFDSILFERPWRINNDIAVHDVQNPANPRVSAMPEPGAVRVTAAMAQFGADRDFARLAFSVEAMQAPRSVPDGLTLPKDLAEMMSAVYARTAREMREFSASFALTGDGWKMGDIQEGRFERVEKAGDDDTVDAGLAASLQFHTHSVDVTFSPGDVRNAASGTVITGVQSAPDHFHFLVPNQLAPPDPLRVIETYAPGHEPVTAIVRDYWRLEFEHRERLLPAMAEKRLLDLSSEQDIQVRAVVAARLHLSFFSGSRSALRFMAPDPSAELKPFAGLRGEGNDKIKPDMIKIIQAALDRFLRSQDYRSVRMTGRWDAQTKQAIRKAQQVREIAQTEILDEDLLVAVLDVTARASGIGNTELWIGEQEGEAGPAEGFYFTFDGSYIEAKRMHIQPDDMADVRLVFHDNPKGPGYPRSYVGRARFGEPHGKGTLTLQNGTTIQGEFVNGALAPDSQAVERLASGIVMRGRFRNGEMVEGKIFPAGGGTPVCVRREGDRFVNQRC